MSDPETQQERFLKRAQMWLAILVGVVTLIVGVYNVKNAFFSQKGPGGLSITVRSAQGNNPVPQARVELLGAGNTLVASSLTDDRGEYHKDDVESGNYSVKVSRAGFETDVVAVSVQPKKMGRFNLTLRPTGSPVKAAIEEVGAGWIRELGSKTGDKTDSGSGH